MKVTTKISLQTQLHSEKFESLTKQSKDIVNKLLEVSVLEEEITRLSGTIRRFSVSVSFGINDYFYLFINSSSKTKEQWISIL